MAKIRKFLELDYGNIIEQKLWDAAIVVLRGKCIILNACVRKEERLKLMS